MTKSVLVFRHLEEEHLAGFAPILEECGYSYRYIETPHDHLCDLDILSPDILIIMGGPMGVYEDDKHPYLNNEISLIQKRITAHKPILGICLGAQLIAAALGAKVYPGTQGKEIGWFPLRLHENAQNTPLKHFDGTLTNMFHWHGDTFDLPVGATLLASSEKYAHQAFTYGHHVMALQCHPEVNGNHLSCFENFIEDMGDDSQETIKNVRAQTKTFAPTLETQTGKFLREWLGSLVT